MNRLGIQILILRALDNIRPNLSTAKVLQVDVNCMGGPAATLTECQVELNNLEGTGRALVVRGEDGQLRYAITDAGRAFLQQYG